MRLILSAMLLMLLAACATMNKAECTTADWRAIGFQDGTQGKGMSYFQRRRTDCSEFGIAPDSTAYTAGRKNGLVEYCRPRNGYLLGKQGDAYYGVCPERLEKAFLAAHADGYGLYERDLRVNYLRGKLHDKTDRFEELDALVTRNTTLLRVPKLSRQKRASLIAEVRQAADELGSLKVSIHRLRRELAVARRDRDAYSRVLVQHYGY